MPYDFKFPDVGEGITEGTIIKWKVREGDKVEADQPLAEVETDKAIVEPPSPKKGYILKLNHKEGETIQVGEVLAVIGEKGEKVEVKKEEKKVSEKGEHYVGSVVGFLEEAPEEEEKKPVKKPVKAAKKKVVAAPSVRKLAQNLKVDILQLTGTGPAGRITQEDVVKASGGEVAKAKGRPRVVKKYDFFGYVDRVPLKGIRKITAEKMTEAVSNAALVTHHDHVDVTLLSDVRKKEKEKAAKKGVHLTYLPFIIKAVIQALKKHPYVASSVEGEEIIIKKYYNIGVAVDTPEGLMVPVIKGADKKKLYELATEIDNFVEKAKTRKIDLMDLRGGVFTITNIGVIGSTYFTPIVNYPETCILGTGRIEEQARVVDGKIVIRKVMPISFTYDHRVTDGAEAARFMNDLRALLEKPKSLVD
jgi:pyruvate dehydrogenase E2 component (dihydrolipoamide acetyltransferase)|tara:strand:+ start:18950 stop:20203 length:1254 start_codon:yes stop_codon:yes gene_type:complete